MPFGFVSLEIVTHLIDYSTFRMEWSTMGFILAFVVGPLLLLQFGLMIAGVISIVRKPVQGNERVLWLLLVVLVSLIGPIIYFAVGSGKLDELAAQQEDERTRTAGGRP
jgi:hypothetical protein